MPVKSASCGHCCCSNCSPELPKDVRRCCLCVCDELCVTVSTPGTEQKVSCELFCREQTGTLGECFCVESKGSLLWDDVDCRWEGIIRCGGLSIPFQVELQQGLNVGTGSGDECYLKVTSGCLGLDGKLFPLQSCGEYKKGCGDRSGGLQVSFSADASECGDIDCTTVDVTISCASFIDPSDLGVVCKGCDCICDCLCITYQEDDCSVTKKACWNGTGWSATFDEDCPWSSQDVTITVAEGANRCCELEASLSRGTLFIPQQPINCPRIDVTWDGSQTGTGDATIQVKAACGHCDECHISSECCENEIPTTVNAVVCESNCDISGCITLNLTSIAAEEITWRGQGTAQCSEGAVPDPSSTCQFFDLDIELVCLFQGMDIWSFWVRIYCGEVLLGEREMEETVCEPLCGKVEFPVEDFINDCNSSISCLGTNVVINISEQCQGDTSGEQTLSETVRVDDDVSLTGAASGEVSETAGIDDSVSLRGTASDEITEGIAVQDETVLQAVSSSETIEGVSFQDSVSLDTTTITSMSEGAGLGDVVTVDASAGIVASETVGIDDTVFIVSSSSEEVEETIGIGDAVTTQAVSSGELTEGIGLGDTLSISAFSSTEITEATGVDDTVTIQAEASNEIEEGIGISDSVSFNVTTITPIGLSEGAAFEDTLSIEASASTEVTEGVGVADTISVQASSSTEVTESVGVSDGVTLQGSSSAELSEEIGIQDTVIFVRGTGITVDETAAIDDTVNVSASVSQELTESVAIADAVTLQRIVDDSLSESFSLSDIIGISASASDEVTEDIGIGDLVVITGTASHKVTEEVSLDDSVVLSASASYEATESIAVSDTVSLFVIVSRGTTEDIAINDVVALRSAASDEAVEQIEIDDSIIMTAAASDEVTEDITIDDSVILRVAASDEITEEFSMDDTVTFEVTSGGCSGTCTMEWDGAEWVETGTDTCEAGCRCPTSQEAEDEVGPGSMVGEQQTLSCRPV